MIMSSQLGLAEISGRGRWQDLENEWNSTFNRLKIDPGRSSDFFGRSLERNLLKNVGRDWQFLVISGPSGVGKTTLIQRLRAKGWYFVPNITTRAPREKEKINWHYKFVSLAQFAELKRSGKLLTHNLTDGEWHGFLTQDFDYAVRSYKRVLVEKSVRSVKKLSQRIKMPYGAVYLLPPSFKFLADRLNMRTGATGVKEDFWLKLEEAVREFKESRDLAYIYLIHDIRFSKNVKTR